MRYKVEYVHTEKINSKWYESPKSQVDSWSLAKELEALLLKYEQLGYKVFSIEPITTPVRIGDGTGSKTDGLIVVFETVI